MSEILTVEITQSTRPGSLAGTVLNYMAQPVEGMFIGVTPSLYTYSDEAGDYGISNIPPGVYDIRIIHPTEGDSLIRSIRINSSSETRLNIVWIGDGLMGLDYKPGDVNGDNNVFGNDVTYGVTYFRGIGSPPPDSFWDSSSSEWLYSAADSNGDCRFLGSDITFLINYFRAIQEDIFWCPLTPPNRF